MVRYRNFIPKTLHHVYAKAIDSNIIFYTTADFLVFYTLYCVLAKKYKVHTVIVCIMPNHFHSAEIMADKDMFIRFHMILESNFALEYNRWHNRKGPLFQRTFGFAPKMNGKRIRECLSYIANNPVVGKLTDSIINYKWSSLAYMDCKNPFSPPLTVRNASKKMKNSLAKLKYFVNNRQPLTYWILEQLYSGLDDIERRQLTDMIMISYLHADKNFISNMYKDGSFQMATAAMTQFPGNEYDIPEDTEDYSVFREMTLIVRKLGINLDHINFEGIDYVNKIEDLSHLFSCRGYRHSQIAKFLHTRGKVVGEMNSAEEA